MTSADGGAAAASAEPVLYDQADAVATITLNRPAAANAVDQATAEALSAALDRLDADPAARVGVLTGAGSGFCAGLDLRAIAAGEPRPGTASRGQFGITARGPEKPLIAAVERYALGGGLEIALACDLIVVGEDVRLGLPEVTRGLVPAAGGVLRLPRRIPQAVAMEMILTGEPIDASTALAWGLVSRVCAPGTALEQARALAARIAANAPLAVRAAKALVRTGAEWTLAEGLEAQMPVVRAVRESEDAAEGARAFVERRDPVWRGR